MADLLIDADSLHVKLRAIVLRRALKLDADTYFVADRSLPDVERAIEEDKAERRRPFRETLDKAEIRKIQSRIHMIVVEKGMNAADDVIAGLAEPGSLAITHDIPLAARLLEKGVRVIDDRGSEYTSDDINVRLSERHNNAVFREMGLFRNGSRAFEERDIRSFSAQFDRLVNLIF